MFIIGAYKADSTYGISKESYEKGFPKDLNDSKKDEFMQDEINIVNALEKLNKLSDKNIKSHKDNTKVTKEIQKLQATLGNISKCISDVDNGTFNAIYQKQTQMFNNTES